MTDRENRLPKVSGTRALGPCPLQGVGGAGRGVARGEREASCGCPSPPLHPRFLPSSSFHTSTAEDVVYARTSDIPGDTPVSNLPQMLPPHLTGQHGTTRFLPR